MPLGLTTDITHPRTEVVDLSGTGGEKMDKNVNKNHGRNSTQERKGGYSCSTDASQEKQRSREKDRLWY